MSYIGIEVDMQDALDQIDTDDLVQELITRPDWKNEMDSALNGDSPIRVNTMTQDLEEMVENFRRGKPIDGHLRNIAWNYLGRSI